MQFFEFTEEQELLRKAVREFAEAEVAPKRQNGMRMTIAHGAFPNDGRIGNQRIYSP
jgi:alkylation response protein AidB-like acyl-CoA dehydrogenase